ncbi:BadF/BadG/BcrA/BcrD ATPase family protein [Arthrobacter sp. H35-D1]|uniref:N-acetylglucosamine kinase n=1 Tax=Arthrobacter sp. H35-D1 TaxID=3046202 RepID=UPI0024B8B047|nr:BadF/BadG/BcrA/BcrD ATPase family protein [Arthrobacter sp. H35-D1]MDJ0312014.1 BadF/BadG/BcrA/BcrD ATPase family protein [Arthrobacter sp. H35-D1]
MQNYLAIDAGGTSTRAVFLDSTGACRGYGTAGGGNPVSRGFGPALEALTRASSMALEGTPRTISGVLVAMAGASLELPTHLYRDSFEMLGLTGNAMIESDLLAAFYSGSYHDDGFALIAGTGAVGARISGSRLAAVADGTGWLLGDEGSGFWLGREVARAVAAALDGRGQATGLTELLLAELGIDARPQALVQGRVRAQQQLIAKVYEHGSIELSRFAPLVFAVQDDAVAKDIVQRAAKALAQTLLAVSQGFGAGEVVAGGTGTDGTSGAMRAAPVAALPLVFGGSVLTKGGTVAQAVVNALAATAREGDAVATTAIAPVLVEDGVVGSAVLVLKRHGIAVDEAVFARIQDSLAAIRG